MKELMTYIDSGLSSLPDNKSVYKFRLSLVDEITERANELTHAGLSDEKVITDLIISEHPDLPAEYAEVLKAEAEKKRKRNNRLIHIFGSAAYGLAVIFCFLTVSFVTADWSKTWVFPVAGTLAYICYFLMRKVIRSSKEDGMFMPVTRIMIAVSVFCVATAVFLYLLVVFEVDNAWLCFIFGVLAMFLADAIYIEVTKMRFSIFFHLLYIVPSFAMVYVILCTMKIMPWHPGWIIIPASLVIVFAIIFVRLVKHNKVQADEVEVDSEWNES